MKFNYRKAKGILAENEIPTKDFAKKIGMKYSTARSYLNGNRQPWKCIEKIKKVLKVEDIKDLLLENE